MFASRSMAALMFIAGITTGQFIYVLMLKPARAEEDPIDAAPADYVPVKCVYRVRSLKPPQYAHGTAFGVSKNLLLTAAHNVLTGDPKRQTVAENIRIEITPNVWASCSVIKYNEEMDIALLKCERDVDALDLCGDDLDPKDRGVMPASFRGGVVHSYIATVEARYYKGMPTSRAKVVFDHGASGAPFVINGRCGGMFISSMPAKTATGMETDHGNMLPTSVLKWFIEKKE